MEKPFILAPMAELSHRALRELIDEFGGCDCYFTEMISAGALVGGGPFEDWYVDNGPCPEKLVYQITGADIEQIVKAAALLDSRDCAGIDINMGCCAPLIRKTGAGIAWMSSIERAGELVERTRRVVKRRLSVKLRLGLSEDFDYLVRFCRCLEERGVDFITLHPRTASEKFKRSARWDYVGRLRRELGVPVAGNGDIAGAAELLRRASGSCDAVMVGRAAVRCPWIFAEARNLRAEIAGDAAGRESFSVNVEETGLRFLELLTLWQPSEFHISRARRFFAFFCDNLKWGTYLKNLLNREESLAGVERVWRGYFAEYGAENNE